MMLPAWALAQDELTVYSTTMSSEYVPFYGWMADHDQHNQIVYPDNLLEDMVGNEISSISFYISTTSSNDVVSYLQGRTVTVSLGTVESFTGFTYNGSYATSEVEEVYTGTFQVNDYVATIELENPFVYEGGWLVFDLTYTSDGTYKRISWYAENLSNLYYACYNYGTSSSPSRIYYMPMTTFSYQPSGGSICRKPNGLNASATGPYTGILSFNERDEANDYTIRYADHPFDPNDEDADYTEESLSESPFEFDGLSSSTTYYVYLRTNCDEGSSSWASASFATDILCYPVVDLAVQPSYTTAAVSWAYQNGRGLEHGDATVTLTDPSDPDFLQEVVTDGTYALFSNLEIAHGYVVSVQNSCEGEPSSVATLNFSTSAGIMGEHPGNVASSFAPFYYSSSYCYSQTLYLASEVGGAAVINGIEYNTNSGSQGAATYSLDVYAANTSLTTISNTSSIPFSQFTQVAQGVEVTWPGVGWLTVPFTTPFNHDGSNLAIIVVTHKTSTSTGGTWNGLEINNRVIYSNGGSVIDPANVSTSTTNYMAGFRFLTTVDLEGCMSPNLLLTDVDSNSLKAVWVAGNGETDFKVEYRAAGDVAWTEAEASTSATEYVLDNLNSNTLYDVRVSALCDDAQPYAVRSARTACGQLSLPYFETFEGYENYDELSCWNIAQRYSSSYPSVYNSNSALSGSGFIYTYSTASSPNTLVSPLIPTEGNNIYCSFWVRGVMPGNGFSVGIMTDPNNPTTFVALAPLPTGQTNNSYSEYEVTTASLSITDQVYLAFRWTASGSYGYLDDVYISEVPTCMRPSSVAVSNVMDNSATITISGAASDEGYTVVLTSEASSQTITLGADETTHTFTGLTPSTQYTVQVKTICSGGEASDRSTDATFTTQCGIIDVFPYTNEFDDQSNFDCWTIASPLNHSGTYIWHKYTGSASVHEYVSYPSGAGIYNSSNSDDWFISPGFAIPQEAQNYVVQWYHFGEGVGSGSINYQVLISTTGTALADFDTVFSELHGGQVFEFRSLSLADYAGDTVWIAFRNVAQGGTGMIIDNFTVRDAGAPMVEIEGAALVDANMAATFTAHLVQGSTEGLTYTWSSAMETAGNATISATDSIATITYTAAGLDTISVVATNDYGTDSTVFYVRVRNCQTITHADLPYAENFDSYTAGTSADIDPCWNRMSLYSSYPSYPTVTSGTRHGSSGNSLYYYPGNSTQPQLAVLPQFDDLSDLYVHFWGYRSSSNVRMEVGVMTDPTDASTFEMVGACEPTATSTWEEFYVSLATYNGQGHYIAFRGICTSSYGYAFYVDDISINVLNACAEQINNVRVSGVTDVSATVSWQPSFGLYDDVTIILRDEDGTTLSTATVADAYEYTFTNLTAESVYEVELNLNCNDEVVATATAAIITMCEGGATLELSSSTLGRSAYTSNTALPYTPRYKNTVTEQIYTAQEIGTAGNIFAVAFNYVPTAPTNNYFGDGKIYLGHIADSALNDWQPFTDLELVYTGSLDMVNGWNEFTLNTPFAYNGVDNLIVAVDVRGTFYEDYRSHWFAAHNAWANAARYYYDDNTPYSGTQSTYGVSYRSDVQFVICGGEIQIVQYNVSVLSSNTAMGTVSSTHSGEVNAGTSVTATATANQGYHFTNWTDANGSVVSTANPYTFIVRNDVDIYANFEADPTQGIDDVAAANVSLQPNPATSMVRVGFEGKAIVEVIDLNGKQLLRTEATDEATLDVSRLARGTYFVRVSSDSTTAVRKLVVK